jgi:hypothetical protein
MGDRPTTRLLCKTELHKHSVHTAESSLAHSLCESTSITVGVKLARKISLLLSLKAHCRV